jgi:hypothetical protein
MSVSAENLKQRVAEIMRPGHLQAIEAIASFVAQMIDAGMAQGIRQERERVRLAKKRKAKRLRAKRK